MSTNNNHSFKNLNVYPNPASGVINISNSETVDKINLIFYESNGRKVFDTYVQGNNTALDISHLNTGIYYLQLITNESMQTEQLIIE